MLPSSVNFTPTPEGNPEIIESKLSPAFPETPLTVMVTVSLLLPGLTGGKLEGDIEAV